jgi:hypothetical protein
VTCSLLYLSRTHSKRQDVKHRDISAVNSGDSGYCNPLINSVDQASNPYFFDQSHTAASSYAGSLPSGTHRLSRRVDNSVDSNDPGIDGLLRIDSSTVFGSDAGLSGHTEQLFGANDAEHEQMFGAVFSPDNSIGHNYRDSSMFSPAYRESAMFSPALSSAATPKDFRIPR